MNLPAGRQIIRGEDPKDFFLHQMPRKQAAARGEDPKAFLQRVSRQRQQAAARQQPPGLPPEGLTGERPDEVAQYCRRVRQADFAQAARMVNPLIRLDYEGCDAVTVELVESTLYFVMLGQERPTPQQQQQVNAPANEG